MELDQRQWGDRLVDMSRNEATGIRQGALDNPRPDQIRETRYLRLLVQPTTTQVGVLALGIGLTSQLIQKSHSRDQIVAIRRFRTSDCQ